MAMFLNEGTGAQRDAGNQARMPATAGGIPAIDPRNGAFALRVHARHVDGRGRAASRCAGDPRRHCVRLRRDVAGAARPGSLPGVILGHRNVPVNSAAGGAVAGTGARGCRSHAPERGGAGHGGH